MKKILLACVALSFMTGSAFAACTQEEAQEKANDFQTKLIQLMQKDPSKAEKWQQRAMDMSKDAQTLKPEDACDYMDKLIKEVEADM